MEVDAHPHIGVDWIQDNGELYLAGDWLTQYGLTGQPLAFSVIPGKADESPEKKTGIENLRSTDCANNSMRSPLCLLIYKVCQTFFRNALAPIHQYRKNALIDSTVALMQGASLSLTSIGRHLPGRARVKDKIKRTDRLLGNSLLHKDIPKIFSNITSMMTRQLSWCVIVVDWSGYPSQAHHVLRASLVCDGRSIPLMSQIVPSKKQNNVLIQNAFLDALADSIAPETKVFIMADAGFQSAWFQHIKSLGWEFIGRIRGNVRFCLHSDEENWLNLNDCTGTKCPEYLGAGILARAEYAQCEGHFYLYKKAPKGRKNKRTTGKPGRSTTDNEKRASAKAPWLIFTSTDEFSAKKVMKCYSRRMQIEQNFRDEKSERFGFGLRACQSKAGERLWVPSLLATLASIVFWLLGYEFENKGFHLHYQANSIRKRRVISFLTLAEKVLRHCPLILRRIKLERILTHLARAYRNMVLVY